MPTTTNLTNLTINHVESQAVYDAMVAQNKINENELYLIPGDISIATDNTPGGTENSNAVITSGAAYAGFQTKANKENAVYFVKGTQTASTNAWTGVLSAVNNLYDGLTIAYFLPKAGTSDNATLTLILGTNIETAAEPVYYTSTSRATTHYGAGSVILLTWVSNATTGYSAVGSATGRWLHADYADGNTIPATSVGTDAATAAKAGSHTYYVLKANNYTLVTLRYSNTAQSALTLNINKTGAKPIYINGVASSSTNYTLPAGTYLVYYDGTNYYFRTDGKITGSITGDAATLNGRSDYLTGNDVAPANPEPTASWGGSVALGTVANKEFKFTMPANPNTHYSANLITGSANTDKANKAGGTNSVYLNLVENNTVQNAHQIVGSGTVSVGSDAAGKITISGASANVSVPNPTPTASWDSDVVLGAVDSKEFKFTMPANPNTHYEAKMVTGANASGKTNASGGTNQAYLNIVENNTVRSSNKIVGGGTVSVASDTSGNITITGANPAIDISTQTDVAEWDEEVLVGKINNQEFKFTMPSNPDTNTTYSLTQDSTDGHKITLTPSPSGTPQTITIPDNDHNYYHQSGSWSGLTYSADNTNAPNIELKFTLPTGTTSTTVARGDHTHTFASLTSKPTTISGYGITDAYTKTEVDGKLSAVFHYKGTKATVGDLPTTGNTAGDVWHVDADGSEYVFTSGLLWEELGTAVDLSGYAQLSGANFTGPVNFGDSVTADDVTTGTLVVTGNASFTNNIQANTINNVTVGSNPKFTDTVYTHPTYTSKSSGLYKITVDGTGHVSAATAVAKSDITGLGIPGSDTNTATAADNILDGSNSGTQITYAPYSNQQSKLSFDTSSTNPSRTDRLNLNGYLYATKLYSGGSEVLTSHQSLANYKTKQSAVSDPTASSTTSTTFIDSISQNANGEITVTKKTLPTYNNYSHPTYDVAAAAAKKIGRDSTGHVVIGDAITAGDVGAATSSHTHAWSDITSGNDDLKAIEALTGTSGFLKKTASNTWSLDTTTYVPTSRTVNGHALSSNVSVTASDVGLGNLTNNKQIKGLSSGTTSGHIVTWGSDGYTVADSGKSFTTATPTSSSTDNTIPTSKAVWAAIAALDVDNITGFDPGATLASLSETDGKISATFQDIEITASQVSDLSITLNGETTTTPSFYAPVNNGNAGYILKANGQNNGGDDIPPTWIEAVPVANGGTGMTAAGDVNAVVISNSTSTTGVMQTVSSGDGAFYATGVDEKPQFGTLPVAQGGTGATTFTSNAVLYGNGTSAIQTKASANGALYATAANGTLNWGTLPVAQGGTGATTFTSGALLIGNGTSAVSTRSITNNTTNTSITNNNTNIPTMNTIYYGLVAVNGNSQSRATTIYVPTTVGSNNQYLKSTGSGGPSWQSPQDSSSASAISSSGTNLVTERDIYYGLPTINNSHAYTSSTTIYAPTAGGTEGQILSSSGSGAPTWVDSSTVGSKIQIVRW